MRGQRILTETGYQRQTAIEAMERDAQTLREDRDRAMDPLREMSPQQIESMLALGPAANVASTLEAVESGSLDAWIESRPMELSRDRYPDGLPGEGYALQDWLEAGQASGINLAEIELGRAALEQQGMPESRQRLELVRMIAEAMRGNNVSPEQALRQTRAEREGSDRVRDGAVQAERAGEVSAETPLRERVAQLEKELRTDRLTGLPNKLAFDEDAALGWPEVVALDVDQLKRLNDTVGHDAADVVLTRIGKELQAAVDPDRIRFYRLSGDEFAARASEVGLGDRVSAELQARLDQSTVELIVNLDGVESRYAYEGIGVSYGTGSDYANADAAATRNKQERRNDPRRRNEDGPPRQLRSLSNRRPASQGDGQGDDAPPLTLQGQRVPATPAPDRQPTQTSLVEPPTQAQRIAAARTDNDAQNTGFVPVTAGDGDLLAGPRPEQAQAVPGDSITPPDSEPQFSTRRDGQATGTTVAKLTAAVNRLTRHWNKDTAPRVKVVADPEGLPDSAKQDPRYKLAEGFYENGTIYLVASNLDSGTRLRQVLAHEAVGHYGFEAIVGDDWHDSAGARLAQRRDSVRNGHG